MVIKPEAVNGGKKIVLRHVSGAKKGELAGSVHTDGIAGIDALTDIPRTGPTAPNSDADAVGVVYQKFVQAGQVKSPGHMDAPDEVITEPPTQTPALTLGHELSALLPTGLDADQHADVMEALARSVKRWDPKPVEPTDEEWQRYLLVARARITDPANGLSDEERATALQRWEHVKANPLPDAQEYAIITAADARSWRAMYSLQTQSVQIASWVDADPEDVKAEVARFRAEYYAKLAAGEDVNVPDKYRTSWRRLMDGSPKDPATVYSHFHAENPALYLNPVPPARFIAIDLETTGLSTKDSHIIEVGMVEYDAKGTEVGRWNRLVRPPADEHGNISTGDETVMAVHKIQVADVIDAPSFLDILPELQERLAGATIIGHNLGFDTKHLKTSMKKYAPAETPELSVASWTGEADTMFHAARHMHGLENNKLVTVSGALGIAYTNGHRAEHDAAVAGEVFFALRKGLKATQRRAIRVARQAAAGTAD
jgi:DNA polymerase III epsilon subunit-like protein